MMISNDTSISALDCEIHVREMLEELQKYIVADPVEVTLRSNLRAVVYRIIYKYLIMMKDNVLKDDTYNEYYAKDTYLQFEQRIAYGRYYDYLKHILDAISEIQKIDNREEAIIANHHIKTMLMHEAGLYLSIYHTLKTTNEIREKIFVQRF